jgi:hypothetical protein
MASYTSFFKLPKAWSHYFHVKSNKTSLLFLCSTTRCHSNVTMKFKSGAEQPIPSIEGSIFTNGVRATSTASSAGLKKRSTFLWKTCVDSSQEDRVDIKQQAVLDGLRLGERLSHILTSQTHHQNEGLGAEELADWPEQFGKSFESAPHLC